MPVVQAMNMDTYPADRERGLLSWLPQLSLTSQILLVFVGMGVIGTILFAGKLHAISRFL